METAVASFDTTVVPATPAQPTLPLDGSADVLVDVDNARIGYAVPGCPVTAWLDPTIEDDISFGTFPEYLIADDGSRWSTQLLVLNLVGAAVTDWSFVLTSPLTGIPGDAERSLISRPDRDSGIELAITASQATFTAAFWDSERSDEIAPQPVAGMVSVTCI